ncbi:hypothetical protein LCGC14_2677660, partial [marine sediment metagenome]
MTAAMVAQMVIAALEIAQISAVLSAESRDPTEVEMARVKANVQR